MTRTIRLVVHEFNDADNPWPYGWAAWAYTAGDSIHVRSPAHLRVLGGVERVMHEAEHALDSNFTNESHHPAWHLCVRSKVPWRFRYHNQVSTVEQAKRLLHDGQLEIE